MSAFDSIDPILGRNPQNVHISNSEMQTFKQCKRKWMLGNYYGLKKKVEDFDGPLPLGVRIHESLEWWYNQLKKIENGEEPDNRNPHPVDEYTRLQNKDNKRFLLSPHANNEDKIKKFNNESELGRVMLEGYPEWVAESNADSDIDFDMQEKALSYTPDEFGGRVTLVGKIDGMIRRKYDNSKAILDFKTCQHFTDYRNAAHHSEQLPLYINLERRNSEENDAKVDGGRYRLLKKVKRSARATPPFYEDHDVRFNKKSLNSHWTRVLGTVREMMDLRDRLDNGEDHLYYAYPTQKMGWECTTCPFFDGCFMLDDGSDAEGFFTENYVQTDPNARYNDKENTDG